MKCSLGLSIAAVAALAVGALSACGDDPAGKVRITEPSDGASVVSPFKVVMAAEKLAVEPASAGVNDGRGHHHIVIDKDLPPKGQPVPADAQHLHFGKGQTDATLDLPPGEHTIRLLFAKGDHIPYDPEITSDIKVKVTEQRKVSFIEPKDGATVTGPFAVKMAAQGLVVEPASSGVNSGRGHHHIIVDADLPANGQPIPSDAQHLHFGGGQTGTTLDLTPGEHTLSLVFADAAHVPYSPYVTASVKVRVAE